MLAVVNTDASVSSEFKLGVFSYWIVTGQHCIQNTAKFSCPVANSTEGELMAIANALTHLFRAIPNVSQVIVKTDCIEAGNTIHRSAYGSRKKFLQIAYIIKEKIRRQNVPVKFEHVKAHKKAENATPTEHINRWCDTQSRKLLRKLVQERKTDF